MTYAAQSFAITHVGHAKHQSLCFASSPVRAEGGNSISFRSTQTSFEGDNSVSAGRVRTQSNRRPGHHDRLPGSFVENVQSQINGFLPEGHPVYFPQLMDQDVPGDHSVKLGKRAVTEPGFCAYRRTDSFARWWQKEWR